MGTLKLAKMDTRVRVHTNKLLRRIRRQLFELVGSTFDLHTRFTIVVENVRICVN